EGRVHRGRRENLVVVRVAERELVVVVDLVVYAENPLPVVGERGGGDADKPRLYRAACDVRARAVRARAKRDGIKTRPPARAADGVQVEVNARVRAGGEERAQLRDAVLGRDAERAEVRGRAEAVVLEREEEEGSILPRLDDGAALAEVRQR